MNLIMYFMSLYLLVFCLAEREALYSIDPTCIFVPEHANSSVQKSRIYGIDFSWYQCVNESEAYSCMYYPSEMSL